MLNYYLPDFIGLFAISIAFNFACVLKEISNEKGFQIFIFTFCNSRISNVTKILKDKLACIDAEVLAKFEYYIKVNTIDTSPKSLEYIKNKGNEFAEKTDKYIEKISAIPCMYSACLLFGLYGILISFIIVLYKNDIVICEKLLLFTDTICLLFLLYCILWDFHSDKDSLFDKLRINLFKQPPGRMFAVKVFLYIFIISLILLVIHPDRHQGFILIMGLTFLTFIFFKIAHNLYLWKISKRHKQSWFTDKTTVIVFSLLSCVIYILFCPETFWGSSPWALGVSVFTCYSAFIIYMLIIIIRVKGVRYRYEKSLLELEEKDFEKIEEILNSEKFKNFKQPQLKQSGFSVPDKLNPTNKTLDFMGNNEKFSHIPKKNKRNQHSSCRKSIPKTLKRGRK